MQTNRKEWSLDIQMVQDMATFGRALILSRDVDPMYPLLARLYDAWGITAAQQLWFTTLYLAFYRLDSAMKVFRYYPMPTNFHMRDVSWMANLPCATERRGVRGGVVIEHLNSYVELCNRAGSQEKFITRGWQDGSYHGNYECFWKTAQTVYQNGRWAAFKWAELLKKVHGYSLAAPDMRLRFCQAPKEGLKLVFNTKSDDIPALNIAAQDLRYALSHRGCTVGDWEELETVLCNFHSLHAGRYYVGHDIDEMQHIILNSPHIAKSEAELLFSIREAVFSPAYLGEIGGWYGIREEHKRAYKKRGIILT